MTGASDPVVCPQCRGPFLPPTMEPSALIECPRCGHRLRVVEWGRPARDELPPAIRRPSLLSALFRGGGGPRPNRPPIAVRRRNLGAALIGGAMVASAFGLAVWRFQTRHSSVGWTGPRTSADTTAAELDAAFAVARRALTSESWASALPLIRQRERVEPLMRRYHATHPWTPVMLTGMRERRLTSEADRRWAVLSCQTERGRVVEIRTESTPSGWKLDWESLTNAPGFEWEEFYVTAPAEARRLRVSALRGSVPDDYFSRAEVEPEGAFAVRLFGTDGGDSVMALVPKASDLGRLFRVELTWEVPRLYVCELRFADPGATPPRVEITAFAQKGWDLGE